MKAQTFEKKKPGQVSIIVPVYNEAPHIEKSLNAMTARLAGLGIDFELIVVESGSTDGSRDIIEKLSGVDRRIRLFHQEKREGMGSAVALGFSNAAGDLLFWYDSDLPYDLAYLVKGLELLRDTDADVVAGRRISRRRPLKRRVYTAVFNFLVNALYPTNVKDLNFAYKLFRKRVFDRVRIDSKSSFFAAEILIKCTRFGFKIIELDIPFEEDEGRRSKLGNSKTVFHVIKDMLAFILGPK